jgi:hypothetical protein
MNGAGMSLSSEGDNVDDEENISLTWRASSNVEYYSGRSIT